MPPSRRSVQCVRLTQGPSRIRFSSSTLQVLRLLTTPTGGILVVGKYKHDLITKTSLCTMGVLGPGRMNGGRPELVQGTDQQTPMLQTSGVNFPGGVNGEIHDQVVEAGCGW